MSGENKRGDEDDAIQEIMNQEDSNVKEEVMEKLLGEKNPQMLTHSSLTAKLQARFSLVWELLFHTFRSVRRSKMNFCLGTFAVLVVVVVVSVLLTVLSNTPMVFLRLAELQVNFVDLRLTFHINSQKIGS